VQTFFKSAGLQRYFTVLYNEEETADDLSIEDEGFESKPLKLHTNFRVRVSRSESKPLLSRSRSLCFYVLASVRDFGNQISALCNHCSRCSNRINPTVVRQYGSDVYAKNAAKAEFEYAPQLRADDCHRRPVYLTPQRHRCLLSHVVPT
jgi:hypothetical protein